jgi:hypothetical protein
MAKVGDVAICEQGVTGLITEVVPCFQKRVCYKGVRLMPPEKAGKPWQSVKPRVLGDIADFVLDQYPYMWGSDDCI